MPTFQLNFVQQTCLKNLESEDALYKENLYDLSVSYNSIDKSEILIIYKFLMVKK